jgi:ATP-dependent exoDNAse (exonuclease V) beta subunit
MTGIARVAQPADIAILFRSRESHREFEAALERRGVQTYVYRGLGFFEADEIQDAMSALRYLADPTSDLRAAAFLRSRIVRLSDPAMTQLAPRLAKAILPGGAAGECDVAELLSQEDATALAVLRVAVPRWLTWVDRMTPAELLDRVLYDSAYHLELRGSRRLQARENLKKLRSLLRRIQNRGYVTLARIADHLERLAVGDESNAAIDAVDAVSLMTIHAAKGLEFPVVFVVNMGRGTGGVRPPVRVATSAFGQPAVAVADFQSDADEEAQSRDREETKRLLYVALTRARDRLYLSASFDNGVCRTGRGSLGEVMPKSLIALFVEAAQATDSRSTVRWTPAGGQSHLLLSRRHDPSASPRVWRPPATSVSRAPDDFN